MRDLELWRHLAAGDADPAELARLAAWPIARRAPYVGAIAPLAEHADPAMRAAAIAALRGAQGATGVRAIARGLDDEDDAVRTAAVEALRGTAREEPYRFTHALFHPRADVRLAALAGELPRQASDVAIHLRADPACAAAAARVPWPDKPLPLLFDLHAGGHVGDAELVAVVLSRPAAEVRAYVQGSHGRVAERTPETVYPFLESCARTGFATPPGDDVLDVLLGAIVRAGDLGHPLARFIEIATPRHGRGVTRRATVSLIGELARAARPELIAACAGLEPTIVAYPGFDRRWIDAAIEGIVRHGWQHPPPPERVKYLMSLPLLEPFDLALACAIVGLTPNLRLVWLAKQFGSHTIVQSLLASDRGWDVMCKLPRERAGLDMVWLSQIDTLDPERYVALAGRALSIHTGERLEELVVQVKRRLRPRAFLVALQATIDPERLGTVCTAISPHLDGDDLARLLHGLLADPATAPAVLALVRAVTDKQLGAAARLLPSPIAVLLIRVLDGPDPPPRDRELALVEAFGGRPAPEIREWILRVAPPTEPRILVTTPLVRGRRALTVAESTRIAACTVSELEQALEPALTTPVTGLVAALERRPAMACVPACAALLGCADALDDVARELDRFGASTPIFEAQLDNAATTCWVRQIDLPPLAHARLWRWEAHTFALAEWIERAGGVLGALGAIQTVAGTLARRTLWRGIAETIVFWRYRDTERFARNASETLAVYCAARIDHVIGRDAAAIVVALVESGRVPLAAVRALLLDHVADAEEPARELLARIVRLDGVPEPPATPTPPHVTVVAKIRATSDLDALVASCRDSNPIVVQESALALCARGEPGQLRLAALLDELATLAQPIAILATVALWDTAAPLAAARALADRPALPVAWQFHLSLALAVHGDRDAVPRALAAVRADDRSWTFRRDDWEALVRVAHPNICALALADSPHHHAYRPAIATLLPLDEPPEVGAALRRFVEVDTDRPRHLRLDVARRLAVAWSDDSGLPIIVEHVCDEKADDWSAAFTALSLRATPQALLAIVDAALVGGHHACSEKRMWAVLDLYGRHLSREQRAELHARILEQAATAVARRTAAQHALTAADASDRLVRVAEVFAWGIRRGVELAGRMFRIHLTSAEREFGHTRLDGNRIYVSPLPMLRGDPHGRDIVEGLVLHELGHHVYHRGEAAAALWKRAQAEGLHHLLNLVADEHLERNLRAIEPAFGDRLKRLGAYAFQHAAQEIQVPVLLACLLGSAARALTATPLDVAFDANSVRLRRGAVLAELDRAGHPLARFARALRMGLGNRAGDPKLAAALELCKNIRSLDMPGLYALTVELAKMFGGAVEIAKVFGGPEGLEFGERDDDVFGAGVEDDILQREVERILHPAESGGHGKVGPRDRLQINVNPVEAFTRIDHVERVRGDRDKHAELAAAVDRHAARLRAYLDELGLKWLPVRARTQGRALDRSRLVPLVTRGDPRILVARQPIRRTDLFLGTIVDCSGSMAAGDNIDRARRFAILVAEAVRPLDGVEARFFGFTDSTIFDAGDARDCHVTALESDGGNNDAAALWHVANVALASPQRAKVLVMISDGLPTECSVPALRGLVTKLTKRKGIVCAQVALRKLEEVCFPHHVVLDDHELDVAVARFGRMIGDLARRSLAS
jgi:hypothetical protein